jgi:hypothetical protein
MYRGISIRLYHHLDHARLSATLQRLRDAGADAVSIVPHHYCLTANSPRHEPPPVPVARGFAEHPGRYILPTAMRM